MLYTGAGSTDGAGRTEGRGQTNFALVLSEVLTIGVVIFVVFEYSSIRVFEYSSVRVFECLNLL